MIAKVLPDVPAIDRVFDYIVPPEVGDIAVGSMVRVVLHGRRVGGWVVGLADEPGTDRPLQPIAKVRGKGPAPELLELATWAAWRWAGPRTTFLRTASPANAVRGLPTPPPPAPPATAPLADDLAADAFLGTSTVVRLPPARDAFPIVLEAARRGDALVLAPSVGRAAHIALRLRRAGIAAAQHPRDWARAAAGGCVVVGARAAVWAPVHPAAIVVVDEHDEAYQEERAPTWNARDVALERARRAGVPCVLTSPCPSLEALAAAPLLTPSRSDERAGWAVVEVVDRRKEAPGLGLYSERLVAAIREAPSVVCVLNRKGRARLLACNTCGELARCEACEAAVEQTAEGTLLCRRCGTDRPVVCLACGASRLKILRAGVTRAREELEHLAGRPVVEVTGDEPGAVPDAPILVGTEAVLHRVDRADVVAFLDFDQELLAPRYRAAEEALALLARAARVVGGRAGGGRILVQTRVPTHEAIDAAVHADPGRLALVESARRTALRFPPETALAIVSGEAAPIYVDGLSGGGVDVLGPASGGRWLVRAPDHAVLCDRLASVARPPGRLRVAVDPLRA
ncbi:MAG: priA [Acidimicrobiales bacterium]|nr:priA [Acidimicrobiales bacterium]